ncbi:MAG: HEPN domain-containing protein [Eubacteriales bacterium]
MARANEMLLAAEENISIKQYRTSFNRSYYAVFHALRAANCLLGFDSSKHSRVIAFFNKEYIKPGKLDRTLSTIIKSSFYLREKSDYDDFFIASLSDAKRQLEDAKLFVKHIEGYINDHRIIIE